MRVLALAALLVAAAFAGCIAPAPSGPIPAGDDAWSFRLPLTINVILAGTEGVDPARLAAELPATKPVWGISQYGTTRTYDLEPIQYDLTWRFHQAPEAFTRAFFAAAQEASFEGPAPQFLIDYDRASGQGRFAASPLPEPVGSALPSLAAPTMTYIDAPKLEEWVAQHRGEHGLVFPQPEYTFLVVDGYSQGHMPQDSYYYYYFDDGTQEADLGGGRDGGVGMAGPTEFHTPKDPTSQRGWGGKWPLAWLDLGAAPSWLDNTPWYPAFEDDNVDHPIWDLQGQEAKLHRNLARHLHDGVFVKIARSPAYDYEWTRSWFIPVHVFVESAAISGSANPLAGVDVETWLGIERMERAFQELAPWVDTEITVEYHYLPQDDPGMAEAVRLAKEYGDPTTVAAGVIKEHVRTNWDSYVPERPAGTLTLPQFFFYFDGLYTFWGPSQGGGFAAADAWGNAWAAFNHIFDLCTSTDYVPCTKGTRWSGEGSMDMLVIHEAGHHVGLMHTRETAFLDEDGFEVNVGNWFWDSTWSVMTYRHQYPTFDIYDKDIIARGHTGWLLNLVAERANALRAAGESPVAVRAAEEGIAATEQLLLQGRWQDAARRALVTWDAIEGVQPLRPAAAVPELRWESFGDAKLVPISPAMPVAIPAPAQLPGPPQELRQFRTTFEVQEGAQQFHLAFRDTQPEAGALRAASLTIWGPDEMYAGGIGDDVFAEAYVTTLRGPGTYTAVLSTNGGVASEYALTLDVGYVA